MLPSPLAASSGGLASGLIRRRYAAAVCALFSMNTIKQPTQPTGFVLPRDGARRRQIFLAPWVPRSRRFVRLTCSLGARQNCIDLRCPESCTTIVSPICAEHSSLTYQKTAVCACLPVCPQRNLKLLARNLVLLARNLMLLARNLMLPTRSGQLRDPPCARRPRQYPARTTIPVRAWVRPRRTSQLTAVRCRCALDWSGTRSERSRFADACSQRKHSRWPRTEGSDKCRESTRRARQCAKHSTTIPAHPRRCFQGRLPSRPRGKSLCTSLH
mmetsp:Transcript_16478/g.62661  ORF Transcript_16478/g.62661 Transcript_16478/m.62661 type:complete len:271 (+) Transcript_16478:834-1646(+)